MKSLLNKIKTQKDKDRVLSFIRNIITLAGGKFEVEGNERTIDKLNRYASTLHFGLGRIIHRIFNSKSSEERLQHIQNMRKLYDIVQKVPVKG